MKKKTKAVISICIFMISCFVLGWTAHYLFAGKQENKIIVPEKTEEDTDPTEHISQTQSIPQAPLDYNDIIFINDDTYEATVSENTDSLTEDAVSANETVDRSYMADIYTYKGNELIDAGELHSGVENLEISLQYKKDPEIMYKLAEIYRQFQNTEGDGCGFVWNFDRAQELYLESFDLTGDSAPLVSFCEMCDEILLLPAHRDGYKMQILEHQNVKVKFIKNEDLAPGEYRYYPDLDLNSGKMVIEGKDIEEYYIDLTENV